MGFWTWATKRLKMMEDTFPLYGTLDGKKVLEVAAFHGELSAQIMAKYPNLLYTITEGRPDNLKEIVWNAWKFKQLKDVIQVDHNNFWEVKPGTFDVVIHFGLLYHLENWEDDLKHALNELRMGGVMYLESMVSDSKDPTFNLIIDEETSRADQAMHGKGSRPSAAKIEEVLKTYGVSDIARYDDGNLNDSNHKYDWVEMNDGTNTEGYRRFWRIIK